MKRAVLTAVMVCTSVAAFSAGLEASSGVTALLYQSVFSYQLSMAVEAVISGDLAGPLKWAAGTRVGIDPLLPEVFVRVAASPAVGPWRPSVGLEAGLTRRASFGTGSLLLQEMRDATEDGISPFYAAVFAAPLSFSFADRFRVSVLELALGTHMNSLGRTVRVQAGIVFVGVKL